MPGRAQIHRAASLGVSGTAQRLPHLEPIQRSFGRHDVTGIAAYMDGPARHAAQAIGAEAFAVGNRVAFAGAPDLRTAAHEAAHVVQQRAGVQLAGGVGATGDPYERHADDVAELVVQGRSAEGLLDQRAGRPGHAQAGAAVVQRQAAAGKTGQSIDDMVTSAVDKIPVDPRASAHLDEVALSAELPDNQQLAEGIHTRQGFNFYTTATVGVNRECAYLQFEPSLQIRKYTLDVARLWRVRYHFRTREFALDLTWGNAVFKRAGQGTVKEIISRLQQAVAGTPIDRPDYDPFADSDLKSTMGGVGERIKGIMAGGASGPEEVGLGDVNRPHLRAELTVDNPITYTSGDIKVEVTKGTAFRVVTTLSDLRTAEGVMRDIQERGADAAANISLCSIHIDLDPGLTVFRKGQPVARLKRAVVSGGGSVSITPDSFELLGAASVLELVKDAASAVVTRQASIALRELLAANAHKIPGIDLRRLLPDALRMEDVRGLR